KGPKVQARPGATRRGYENIGIFYRRCLSSPHLPKLGLGQGFKGYYQWIWHTLLIKIRNTRHIPLGETILKTPQS
ncbi:MAG: hypothetical protein PVI76_11960, partial [Desulfobacterales bacterium]